MPSMTTPEPVSPTSPVRISSDTTDGRTRAAMSATEPGSRVTAGRHGRELELRVGGLAGRRFAAKNPDHRADRADQQRGHQQADERGRAQPPLEQGLRAA